MTDRNRNALIGLFAVGGMLCLAVLVMLFSESRGLFQRGYLVRAKFDVKHMPPSVRQGTEVSLAGLWVGNVDTVELVDPGMPSKGLIAVMRIDRKFRVPKGSEAQVIMPLMGQPAINIVPPSVPNGETTDEIAGRVVNPLETIIDPKLIATIDKTTEQIGELASALTPAANAITDLLEKRTIDQVEGPQAAIQGMTANLSTAIQRLYNVLTDIDVVLGDRQVQNNLKLTLDNFRTASEGVKVAVVDLQAFSRQAKDVAAIAKGTMSKVDDTVDLTRKHIDNLGHKLLVDADKLSTMLDSFVLIGESLAGGEGTAAMFLRDPKLYDELLLTFQRLGAAASEMQLLIKQWEAQGMQFRLR